MIFGAQYYRPPFPESSCWERDMANMKRLGFNTVKFWAVWNWIEKTKSIYDFEELDSLVEIAGKNGLGVILNTIPEGAPHWTLEDNLDSLYTTKSGEVIAYGGPPNIPSAGWPGLCPDKPSSGALIAGFIEKVASHYRDNEQVVAIDVWNEPHLEPMFDYRGDMLCYCEHSIREFRAWLKAKYGSPETLNEKWFRRYADWGEVEPPRRFGTWTDMMDWRLFWIDNLRRWLKSRVVAARRGAPGKTIQTHVAYSAMLGNKLGGGLANELGDEFALAPEVDVFGLSSFPKWLQGKNHVYVHLAHNEIVAEASRGKPFYQVELQGGAGKAGLLGGEVPDGRDITLWNYNTIAAGGKGVLYWQYAPEPAGLESPGFGLTGFEGQNTERSRAAGKCAALFDRPDIDSAKRVLSSNAIYLSRHSEVLCFCDERREDLYAGSFNGVYKAAYRSGIPVRFVHEDYLDCLAAEKTGTLYMPMPLVLSDREIGPLLRFVEGGGTLVAEAGFGLYDRNGKLDQSCGALKEIFGLNHVEIQGLPDWGFVRARMHGAATSTAAAADAAPAGAGVADGTVAGTVAGTGFSGKQYRHVVEAAEGVEVSVLAEFEDGEPAMTERRLGAGKAVFIATFAGLSHNELEDADTRDMIAKHFDRGGYPQIRNIAVTAGGAKTASLWPVLRLLENENGYLLVIVNHLMEEARITVEFDRSFIDRERLELTVGGSDGLVLSLEKAKPGQTW